MQTRFHNVRYLYLSNFDAVGKDITHRADLPFLFQPLLHPELISLTLESFAAERVLSNAEIVSILAPALPTLQQIRLIWHMGIDELEDFGKELFPLCQNLTKFGLSFPKERRHRHQPEYLEPGPFLGLLPSHTETLFIGQRYRYTFDETLARFLEKGVCPRLKQLKVDTWLKGGITPQDNGVRFPSTVGICEKQGVDFIEF